MTYKSYYTSRRMLPIISHKSAYAFQYL